MKEKEWSKVCGSGRGRGEGEERSRVVVEGKEEGGKVRKERRKVCKGE